MELVVRKDTLKEIAKWINEKVHESEIEEFFGKSVVSEKDVKEYLVGVMESNLQYDFQYEFGLD